MNNKKNELISLKNKIAVVAGGSNRTGRAIAESLAQAGAKVVVADLNPINAEIVVQAIADRFRTEAAAVTFDAMKYSSVSLAIQSIQERLGRIEICINSQQVFLQEAESSNESMNAFMENYVKHIIYTCKQVAGSMILSGTKGSIVNIVPVRDFAVTPELQQYSSFKYSIAGLTRTFSAELKKHGIDVFAIAPVSVQASAKEEGRSEACFILPDDIARLVTYCLSVYIDAVRGKVISLNGDKIFIDLTH